MISVELGSQDVAAAAVAFDPELDVAVLYAPGLKGTVLQFATATPDRGVQGAAVGYPGGGPMVVIPAGVAGSYPATGRDIYNKAVIDRTIIELRAAIQPGDSGGPLILPDGTIGGLVFAESRDGRDGRLRADAHRSRGRGAAGRRAHQPGRRGAVHPLSEGGLQ